MSCPTEYRNPAVGASGDNYVSLRTYNYNSALDVPICDGIPSMCNAVVPKYCPAGPGPNYPPKYDTLHHGQKWPAHGGYFNVKAAYPYTDGCNCGTEFVVRPCDGFIDCPCPVKQKRGCWCP